MLEPVVKGEAPTNAGETEGPGGGGSQGEVTEGGAGRPLAWGLMTPPARGFLDTELN